MEKCKYKEEGRHERGESKGKERNEKKMRTEAEYKKGKGGSSKNYKGKCC